jgi:GTP-binding protein EngB required for normal cell division
MTPDQQFLLFFAVLALLGTIGVVTFLRTFFTRQAQNEKSPFERYLDHRMSLAHAATQADIRTKAHELEKSRLDLRTIIITDKIDKVSDKQVRVVKTDGSVIKTDGTIDDPEV